VGAGQHATRPAVSPAGSAGIPQHTTDVHLQREVTRNGRNPQAAQQHTTRLKHANMATHLLLRAGNALAITMLLIVIMNTAANSVTDTAHHHQQLSRTKGYCVPLSPRQSMLEARHSCGNPNHRPAGQSTVAWTCYPCTSSCAEPTALITQCSNAQQLLQPLANYSRHAQNTWSETFQPNLTTSKCHHTGTVKISTANETMTLARMSEIFRDLPTEATAVA
jgi:hypothetical protein